MRLVNQQGRLKADWNDIASILGTGRTESAVHQKFNKISRARDGDKSLYEQYTLLDKQEGTQELDGAPEPLPAGCAATPCCHPTRVLSAPLAGGNRLWIRPRTGFTTTTRSRRSRDGSARPRAMQHPALQL